MLESRQNYVKDEKVRHSLNLIASTLHNYKRVAVACSFGKDSIAVLHLALRVDRHVPVFFINTKFKPKETLEFRDLIVKQWHLNFKEYMSKVDVPLDLHLTDPDECCRILKVEPTREAVKDLDAWITGLRNTEGRTRLNYREIEQRGLVKINPILPWTEADLWRYTAVHKLPVHPWYELGYRSIGCACCSAPNTEEERGGRWKGTSKCGGECGIHTCQLK